jgi:hypothetical protein
MRYLKSLLVGVVAAVITSVLWVLVVLILPVFLPFLISRFAGGGGSGGGAARVGSGSILAVALAGFLLGFFWTFRRTARVHQLTH